MSPKYVIFILPLIIIWIFIEINKLKNGRVFSIFLVLISIFFGAFEINNYPMKRPPSIEALKIVAKDKSKHIVTNETDVFNTYLGTKKIFIEENFILLDEKIKFPNSIKSIWFICLNNPSFQIGNQKLPDDKKCTNFKSNNENFKKVKEVKIKEFILKKFQNNNF